MKCAAVAFVALMVLELILRGLVPAFHAGKNDFSDPFCAAWAWRHGQNPYDIGLASNVNKTLAGSGMKLVPVYPPTTYALVAPFTFLSWREANVFWSLIGISSIGIIALALLRTNGWSTKQKAGAALLCLIFGFYPFHTSIHVANVSSLSISLIVVAAYLAVVGRAYSGGLMLAIATGLKPQLGIFVLVFYIVHKRWKLAATSVSGGLLIASIALARIPVSPATLWSSYTNNLHYWFAAGGQNDFTTANPLHFQLVNAQVGFYQLLQNAALANVAAWSCFFLGVIMWAWNGFRSNLPSQSLGLASLLALSLVPFYHRPYDLGVLVFALCWALSEVNGEHRSAARVVIALYCVLALPGQGAVMHLQAHLPNWFTSSWGWNLFLAPYAVWTLLCLNAVLLHAFASVRHSEIEQLIEPAQVPVLSAV